MIMNQPCERTERSYLGKKNTKVRASETWKNLTKKCFEIVLSALATIFPELQKYNPRQILRYEGVKSPKRFEC